MTQFKFTAFLTLTETKDPWQYNDANMQQCSDIVAATSL